VAVSNFDRHRNVRQKGLTIKVPREVPGKVLRADAHPRRGPSFQVAARMADVIRAEIGAATGMVSTSTAVAAHPIEQKASANVASRDEVWRRRNWLRLA